MIILRFSIVFIILLMTSSSLATAQKSNLSAYERHIKSDDYSKAKEAIDAAIVHRDTRSNATAWANHGDIYRLLYMRKTEGLQNPLLTSADSYRKALELDSKARTFFRPVSEEYEQLGNFIFQEAVNKYNERAYTTSARYYEYSEDIAAYYNKIDSLAIFNQGLAYEGAEEYDKAIAAYQRTADLGYSGPRAYSSIVFILQKTEQSERALELLAKARKEYPNDIDLLTSEVNLFLEFGRIEDALGNLSTMIELGNATQVIYYSRAYIYNALGMFDKAEGDYLEALKLDASYFDANYALGAMYYNMGVEKQNEANQLDDNEAYAKEKKASEELIKKGIPYLEKASTAKPEDPSVLFALKQSYAQANMLEKYKEVSDKLKALGY